MTAVVFAPLSAAHLPLLHRWLQAPHVREFWDDGDRAPEQVRAHYFEDEDDLRFIFTLDGQPAGYVQAYPVDAASEFAAWRSPVRETWGIDLYIGEAAWLGRGQAAAVIHAFLRHLHGLRPDLRRVLIDPETRNERARHVYAKAGFEALATVEVDGKALRLMGVEVV